MVKKQKSHIVAEVAGWYGTCALIAGYGLASFGVFGADSIWFQMLNLTGALGILTIAADKHVTQSVVVNIFWAVIALLSLVWLAF